MIQLNCNASLQTIFQWTIKNCSASCSSQIAVDPSITTTYGELSIPARTLAYGTYELQLRVTMAAALSVTASMSAFVRITPSGITPNPVRYGTSMITLGYDQALTLDPGSFSSDLDGNAFNASVSDRSTRSTLVTLAAVVGVEISVLLPHLRSVQLSEYSRCAAHCQRSSRRHQQSIVPLDSIRYAYTHMSMLIYVDGGSSRQHSCLAIYRK